MRNRYSRYVCLIIAVFILVSDFGFENIARELPISILCLAEEKELILSHKESNFGTLLYVDELSGTSDNSVENEIESCSSGKKREHNSDHEFFYSHHSLLLGETVYVVSEQTQSLEHYEETIVTQYIHALDGKKRV